MDEKRIITAIWALILIVILGLIIWGIVLLVRWAKRTIEKQQEISMIKAKAIKTIAENEKEQKQQAQRHYMSQAEYDQYKREHGIK